MGAGAGKEVELELEQLEEVDGISAALLNTLPELVPPSAPKDGALSSFRSSGLAGSGDSSFTTTVFSWIICSIIDCANACRVLASASVCNSASTCSMYHMITACSVTQLPAAISSSINPTICSTMRRRRSVCDDGSEKEIKDDDMTCLAENCEGVRRSPPKDVVLGKQASR